MIENDWKSPPHKKKKIVVRSHAIWTAKWAIGRRGRRASGRRARPPSETSPYSRDSTIPVKVMENP